MTGCPFCGYCQGFGCAVNDRASSANTVLKKAIDTGRCEVKTGCNVTRLIHQNGKIEGVEYCSNGSDAPEIIKADLVIVVNDVSQQHESDLHVLLSGFEKTNLNNADNAQYIIVSQYIL